MCLRTFAVGLLLSALFIMGTVNKFLLGFFRTSPASAFQKALQGATPEAIDLVGAGVINPAAYIIFCMGLGFFIASVFWPAIEYIICAVLKDTDELLGYLRKRLFKKEKPAAHPQAPSH